MLLVERNFI